MVEVIQTSRTTGAPNIRVEIHAIERLVEGYQNVKKVYGQVLIGSRESIFAQDLKLKTLTMLLLTPETPTPAADFYAKNAIFTKGVYNNFASIDIYNDAGVSITAGTGPNNGSVWLNFLAVGE